MKPTKDDIDGLKLLQPELTTIGNRISGCFFLSACLENKTKGRGKKLACHSWNTERKKNPKHINKHFHINILLDESLYPSKVNETSEKLLSWKSDIPSEYWHINSDNTLCLSIESDIKLKQQNSKSFACFINELLTEYFYYMCYVKKFGNEPWEAYRHGLFAALDKASEGINESNSESIFNTLTSDIDIWGGKKKWNTLLNKMKCLGIKHNNNCPFCQRPTLVSRCNSHKKQIKGYNKILRYLSNQGSKQ
ncbi:MAG: hypothetical protein HFP76_00645 [Methylococcales symbiont of Iophon sp. n. MRB-2018]|nr:MAG: hypothetical protein HFP76_00645 [Methylococcales symbiont of Iophon sp. n. MRB-2018]